MLEVRLDAAPSCCPCASRRLFAPGETIVAETKTRKQQTPTVPCARWLIVSLTLRKACSRDVNGWTSMPASLGIRSSGRLARIARRNFRMSVSPSCWWRTSPLGAINSVNGTAAGIRGSNAACRPDVSDVANCRFVPEACRCWRNASTCG